VLIADSPGDFASAVLRVLRDPHLAATLGRNGRDLVRTQYDYRAIRARLLEIYRRADSVRRQ